jgi:predicted kinase
MEAVIFVGLQGSGKSTYFKDHFEATHVRINMDTLKTRKREDKLLAECIDSKKDFVVDNTNPTVEQRAKYIQLAKAAGYTVKSIYFDISVNECKKRNAERKTSVPLVAIYTTKKKMVVPSTTEGFDDVVVVKVEDRPDESVEGWIGVDLDGTLAEYSGWRGIYHIGKPIPKMVERIKNWMAKGKEVRIVTARVAPRSDVDEARKVIETWLQEHFGTVFPITHEKDMLMIELWDDRCVQVVPNTGERVDGKD